MKQHSPVRRLVALVLVLALVTPTAYAASPSRLNIASPAAQGDQGENSGLYRTSLTVRTGPDWTRLDQLGVVVLNRQDDKATVVVDDEQLRTLARLRFDPKTSDELGELLRGQGPERAWLQTAVQPLVDQGIALRVLLTDKAATGEAVESARRALRSAMHALTPEQRAGIESSSSLDDDADGLTNTEEAWWCTNPLNPNSDGDVQGYTDGQEVAALLDFSLPRSVRWSYGPPFGPPNPWPNFNNQNGSGVNVCNDGDWDTIPDFAEAYVVGTRVGTGNSENTDGDKFDDGQELFGITYCPGGSTTCGYGSYPRTQDYSFITSGMPSWVRPPGDSPFVAAYPVIEFLVDPATIRVVTRQIHTSERTITQGEEISTGFAETTGSSTTVGTIDTNTHSTWQENSTTEGGIEPARAALTKFSTTSLDDSGQLSIDGRALVQMPELDSCADRLSNLPASPIKYDGVEYPALVSDSLFLFSPSVHDFDIQYFLEVNSGPLEGYHEELDGTSWTASEIIRYIAMLYGVNPQVVLVLLEAQGGVITEGNAEVLSALPSSSSGIGRPTFYAYVDLITRRALTSFEQARYGAFDGKLAFPTGETRTIPVGLNPGTAAVQVALSELLTQTEWSRWATQDNALFIDTFEKWFGNPLAEPDAACTSNTLPDGYILPFPVGETWYYTGGPHHYLGVSHCAPGTTRSNCPPGAWSSIDVAQARSIKCPGGAYPQDEWIVAAQGGDVELSSQALVVIDHGDGWKTYYSHVASQDRVGTGRITRGSRVGHPSCEVEPSGSSTGIHLHFAIWKAGVGFVDIAGSSLSKWRIGETTHYNGTMTKGSLTRTADTRRINGTNDIANSISPDQSAIACYAPGMTSAISGQPIYFNQQQKPISFGETIGKLFQGFVGKLTRSGSLEELTRAPDSLSGCSGNSCSDQVRYQTTNSLNFSDNRSGGQCSSAGGSPGGDSSSGFGGGGAGMAINNNGDGTWDRLRVWSQTTTSGEGFSTSHSELRSQTEYSEITRSQTNTLVSSEAWSTATTVDPTQAATLTFNYNLYNTGSDAAVQLTGVRINILIGDLPVITWNAPDRANILPGQAKGPFGSDPINLTLDQLAAIDNGAPIRVVLADYGYNDSLYDQDAWGRGVLFHVDDGIADGDESSDTYLITTGLVQGETYQDVLARYFPVEVFDAGPNDPRTGTLTNIRTPEFDANGEITGWNDHRVGEHGWWELAVSLGGETPGVQNFKDMPAKPRTDVYLRYVEDSDGDGYSDRAEIDGMSDPNNPDIHPRPLLVAAQHRQVSGSTATVQLALQNIGNFDASSVEVWAVAPDDSITLTDNLIGGGGRVKAGSHVVLGARTGNLSLANWAPSTATPYPAGQYTGLTAKTFTLRANGDGNIGSTANLTISWSTNGTTWTELAVGAGYTPLTPLALSDGLTVAFSTGYIAQTKTFSFQAALPIDTFSYTINRTPHTPPLIVVSYNDPAGNHKFVSDVQVTPIQADLTGYLGQMRYGFELDIMAETPAAAGANTAYLVFNNPAGQAIHEDKLFVEFAKPDGTVVKEYVLANQTFQPGPNVVALAWNTADFTPAFDPSAEYHILVFAADRQGTIFENTVKKLSQVGHDRLPLAVLPDSAWNFGTAQQGTLLKRTIAVANVGYHDLLTFVQGNPGFTLSDSGTRHLPGGDLALYELTLNTAQLPVGQFQSTVTIRTSDPTHPSHTVNIQGTVTAMPADLPPGALQRPMDWPVTLSGAHYLGEVYEFSHNLGPDPSSIHPIKVYSQDYGVLWGVGKYAQVFNTGTAPGDYFGDGRDGVLTVNSGQTSYTDNVRTGVNGTVVAGQALVPVNSVNGFNAGDFVLLHQSRGIGAGVWEVQQVRTTQGANLVTEGNLTQTYVDGGDSQAQVIRIPQFSDCTINSGGTLTAHAWDGNTGGTVAFKCRNSLTVNGSISANGLGYRGGTLKSGRGQRNGQGEGYPRDRDTASASANGNGGGGGRQESGDRAFDYGGGGGGGNSTSGGNAQNQGAVGGGTVGAANFSSFTFGGGGGVGGGPWDSLSAAGPGGIGGGAILAFARTIGVVGTISATGNDGECRSGGGGAGGSILLRADTIAVSTNRVTATGGNGDFCDNRVGYGGNGGAGRIRLEYCTSVSGATNPSASTQSINCYIAEQIEASPYNTTRLLIPERFANGRTYQSQFGRRQVFNSSGDQLLNLRTPAAAFANATLDALVSGMGVGSATIRFDIGDDGNGTWDWEWTGSVNDAVVLSSPNLAAAFNRYWAANSAPTGGTLDVPVKVYLSKAGQVLLTNLQVTPTGSKLRHVRLPAQNYSNVTISLTVGQTGSGDLTVAADVGNNGSVDWTWSSSATYPQALTTSNLATAINTYLQGQSGEVDVPIRFYVSPFVDVSLQTVSATPAAQPDVSVATADISFSPANPSEGDAVTVGAVVHNLDDLASGPLTASFYATLPNGLERSIGSAFVPSIPPSSSSSAQIAWNTLGFTGDVPVRVVVDPYNRVVESNEDNNQASKPITILTRADLHITAVTLSDDEPATGQAVDVTLTYANQGQTAAASSVLALYAGHPDAGGALICEQPVALAGNGQSSVTCPWTAGAPGPLRLLAMVDRDDVVRESDEGNNDAWHDVYVGLAGPLLLDSGSSTNDPAYTPSSGFGVLDEGQPDIIQTCGGGTAPEDTLRRDPGGRLVYRFDHLLPGHFYHLDVTLRQCDNIPRQERVYVDSNLVAGPVDLGDTQARYLSLLLDPALYGDHAITVAVEAAGGDGALVAEVNLYDIDYRYADAGGGRDPQYPGAQGYGWLDGVSSVAWGSLPYQSARINQTGNQQSYRFDGLQPGKRYMVNLTYFQSSGAGRQQRVEIDGLDSGLVVNTGDYTVHRERVFVPGPTYASDGSIVIRTVRSDAGATGAMVNEISLEELTVRSPDITLTPAGIAATQAQGLMGSQPLAVGNIGTANLSWTITEAPTDCASPGNVAWLGVSPSSGTTAAGGSAALIVSLDSRNLSPATYNARLCVASNDPDQPLVVVPVQLTVTPATNVPRLTIPTNVPGNPYQTVTMPVEFTRNGTNIATTIFSVDYDQTCLQFDPTDSDGDGVPDAVTFSLSAAFQGSVTFNAGDTDGELDFFIGDTFPPLSVLPDGTPATIQFRVICQSPPGNLIVARVGFSTDPRASFGGTSGGSVPGVTSDGSVEIQSARAGDCNADTNVDAGDISATVLEIFDGDGSVPAAAPGGTFPGSPLGCDANQDATIDAGDISCTVLLIFNGPDACSGALSLDAPGAPGAPPALSLLEAKVDGERMTVPVAFTPGDHQISSVVFAIDYDPTAATIDPTDANGDGIPDAVTLNLPPEYTAAVLVDQESGQLRFMIADISAPLAALPEQVIATVTYQTSDNGLEAANIRFSELDPPSFGDVEGRSVTGSNRAAPLQR